MSALGTDPLLPALAAGDERAFAALYDRFAPRMYRVALRILGRPEDAEDAVQEVFLAIVRSHERLANVRDLTAYLFAAIYRAAGRCAMRRARAVPLSPAATEEAIAPLERTADNGPDSARLQRAVRALPDEQREVVSLKIDGELTFAQIAEIVGVSISTAASRYRYALRKLRDSLMGQLAELTGAADRRVGAAVVLPHPGVAVQLPPQQAGELFPFSPGVLAGRVPRVRGG
ncbi:MAG: sigma-70 family RNA polymerase sigma factor [Thermoguttaceae bacterium]